jgi:hypothetical protein
MQQETNTVEVSITDLEPIASLPLLGYRPDFYGFVGSAHAAILLNQILYWWEKVGRRPFYKFKNDCPHPMSRAGDSWCAELGGWSIRRFDLARHRIATPLQDEANLEGAIDAACISELPWLIATDRGTRGGASRGLVFYWVDSYNVTWYAVNERLVQAMLDQIEPARYSALRFSQSVAAEKPAREITASPDLGKPQDTRQLAITIRRLTGIDVTTSSEAQRLITDLAAQSIEAADIEQAAKIFSQKDWRGQKGELITLALLPQYAALAKDQRDRRDQAERRDRRNDLGMAWMQRCYPNHVGNLTAAQRKEWLAWLRANHPELLEDGESS